MNRGVYSLVLERGLRADPSRPSTYPMNRLGISRQWVQSVGSPVGDSAGLPQLMQRTAFDSSIGLS
jgi:hypothetical protein